jgi:hypothetical protein
MVYCSKCGNKNDDDAEFCNKCGTRLNSQDKEDTLEERVKKTTNKIEEKAEELGKTIEKAGKRFESKMENSFGEFQKSYDKQFNIFGPLIWSFLGLIILRIIIWLFVISKDDFIVLGELGEFLYSNILIFFGLMLLNTYDSYFKRKYKKQYKWISPGVSTISFIVTLWLISKIFIILDTNLDIPILTTIANFIDTYLIAIFVIALLLAYGFVMFILPFVKDTKCN